MTRLILTFSALAIVTVLILGQSLATAHAQEAPADALTIDPVHSSVVFKIEHMGVANFYGRFNDISGTVAYDPDNPADSAFQISIAAQSVDTGNQRRDNHLRGPDFFNHAQFPAIDFQSKRVTVNENGTLQVTGDLSLHGVTKELTIPVSVTGHRASPRGTLAGFEANFTLKRSEFGMTYGIEQGALGDEVTLIVSLEAGKQ